MFACIQCNSCIISGLNKYNGRTMTGQRWLLDMSLFYPTSHFFDQPHFHDQSRANVAVFHKDKTIILLSNQSRSRACDPREGTRGSGIICCRKPGILRLNYAFHFNGQSDSSLKRIIPEPRVPSRGLQAQGTRLLPINPTMVLSVSKA